MTKGEYLRICEDKIQDCKYQMRFYKGWNYNILKYIPSESRRRGSDWFTYSNAIIMFDTETSKSCKNKVEYKNIVKHKHLIKKRIITPVYNYVVAWTISIRCFHHNIVTLYGNKPSELVHCMQLIRDHINADYIYMYAHNMPYDWRFLQTFIIHKFDNPVSQLNVKPHYPISIQFENGIILKDSLILAQKALGLWAADLGVEHQKEKGKWDYEKIRSQREKFSPHELDYIEHDTLAGVECIDIYLELLGVTLSHIPFTATGIPRKDIQVLGRANKAKDWFKRCSITFEHQQIMEKIYHGGYVHADRHFLNTTITEFLFGHLIECKDFESSYPFVMLAYKYPSGQWHDIENCSIDDILAKKEDHAFTFKLILYNVALKDYDDPMPMLQLSKCEKVINPITDNGRILAADYVSIYYNEIDLEVFAEHYKYNKHLCTEVKYTTKDYLPRWFTDYIFELYKDKTTLKGVDGEELNYMLKKGKLNSCYGMCVQHPIKEDITEDYDTGDYDIPMLTETAAREKYDIYQKSRNSILPYSVGVWVTSYAFRNLFELGKCALHWLYSDTDSCYSAGWDEDKVNAYNEHCKELLRANGYGPVYDPKGNEHWLGCAVTEGDKDRYTEFRTQGAKRYAGRCKKDGMIHQTTAGVPKRKGAECLNNDLENYKPDFCFDGLITGKKTHAYMDIPEDAPKNLEVGYSIDLIPCDYILDSAVYYPDFEDLLNEEDYINAFDPDLVEVF